MTQLRVTPLTPKPEFDVIYFMEICGETRVEHALLEKLENAWTDWQDRLHAYKLQPTGMQDEEGFLFIYLTEGVEDMVEEAWQKSQSEGMFFHNLAITLVMSAAQSLIPEMLTGCAPLPKPGQEVLSFFTKRGLEWNPATGSLDRQYAVYTPLPYRGGCEICMQSSTCPNSTTRQN